jgi:hypothetical protein
MGPGTKQHLDLHTCGNGAWHKTTPGFVHLWEWGLAQNNTWICAPVGMGPGARQHLDLQTWNGTVQKDNIWICTPGLGSRTRKYLDLHT